MTQEQRLVSQYIDVAEPIQASVVLKLIVNVTDHNALVTLQQATEKYKEAGESYKNALKAAFEKHEEKSYGDDPKTWVPREARNVRVRVDFDKKSSEFYTSAANDEIEKLKLQSALRRLHKASRLEPHHKRPYLKRFQIEAALKLWFPASRTAMKALYTPAIFAANFALGRFEACASDIPRIQEYLERHSYDVFSGNEGTLLCGYSALATCTPDFVKTTILPIIIRNHCLSNHAAIFELCEAFGEKNFSTAMKLLGCISEDLKFSLYGSHLVTQIREAIITNFLHKIALPIARAPFSYFGNALNLDPAEISRRLFALIEDGRLLGKIDLVSGDYIGGVRTPQSLETEQLLARVLALRQKTEALVFKQAYNSFGPPKAAKSFSLNYYGGHGGMGFGANRFAGGFSGGGFSGGGFSGDGFGANFAGSVGFAVPDDDGIFSAMRPRGTGAASHMSQIPGIGGTMEDEDKDDDDLFLNDPTIRALLAGTTTPGRSVPIASAARRGTGFASDSDSDDLRVSSSSSGDSN